MTTADDPFPTGTPCWAELLTDRPEQARTFYADIFGWEQIPVLGSEPGAYGVFYEEGEPDAGIGRLPADPVGAGVVPGAGLTPRWLIHFSTHDVDATVAIVEANGGRVVRPASDRIGLGRSAVVADPTGATFAVTELDAKDGPSWQNESGALVWSDLCSSDTARAREFYKAVFGYEYGDPGRHAEWSYASAQLAGSDDAVCGLMSIQPEVDGLAASYWLGYLLLDKTDTDTAARKTEQAGGRLELEPYDSISGRTAMLSDPQGAVFAIIGGQGAARFS